MMNSSPGSSDWNDQMYLKHPTPYNRGLAGFVQRSRVRSIVHLASPKRDDRILEIGCESGGLLALLPNCREIVGFDISQEAINEAKNRLLKFASQNYRFILGDAEQILPFQRGSFDIIICSEMLEHVPRPEVVLNNIREISNEGTKLIMSVPIEKPKIMIKAFLEKLQLFKIFFPGIEAGQSEWHLHAFDKNMFLDLCKGRFRVLRIKNVLGLHYVFEMRAA